MFKKLLFLILFIGLPCYSYECVIPEQSMPDYIEYTVECIASPKIQTYQFSQSLESLDQIWLNYDKIANDKYSYTTHAEYVKQKTYTHWLFSKVGEQIYEHVGVQTMYGQMLNQKLLENNMDKLYGYFPKVARTLQQEYITAFIQLGNKCITEGKFTTQMERDVYICHCLYLLRATTDRQSYYRLSFHIKKVTPLLVKENSLYPIPRIKKFVNEQLNLKDYAKN